MLNTLSSRHSTGETAYRRLSYARPEDARLHRWCIQALEALTGQQRINRIYARIQATDLPDREVWSQALKALEVQPAYPADRLSAIPRQGPLVLIANHPFGIVDGLMLGHLLATVREDFSLLVNSVLCGHDPRIEQRLLPVDFNEGKAALQVNLRTRQLAVERLAAGEAIGIFPSGGVATAPGGWGPAQDLEWKRFTARIIQAARATVVPVFFQGQNSRLFHLASQIHPALRLGLLLYEANNKRGQSIPVHIGAPIPFDRLAHLRDRQALTDRLREITFQLHAQP